MLILLFILLRMRFILKPGSSWKLKIFLLSGVCRFSKVEVAEGFCELKKFLVVVIAEMTEEFLGSSTDCGVSTPDLESGFFRRDAKSSEGVPCSASFLRYGL